MAQQIQGTRSEPGPDRLPKRLPRSARCTPRQLELQMDLPPCRKRSHTRGLKSLAERLEASIDRIANDDTISPEHIEFFLWKLRVAEAQLDRRLKRDRGQAPEVPV